MISFLIFFNIFIVGCLLGSFLNVLILRIHNDEQWWKGRSMCPYCRKELTALELIPIISYLLLKGKCKGCSAKISLQYPIIEFLTGILFVGTFYYFGLHVSSVILALIAFCLLGTFVTDLKYMEVYDIFMIPAIVAGVGYQFTTQKVSLLNLAIGALVGFGFFLLQYVATRGKGIGAGDLRIGLLMGILLGWPLILISLMIAYIAGSIISLTLIAFKKLNRKDVVPLGVFLIPALCIVLIFSSYFSNVVSEYLSIFTLL